VGLKEGVTLEKNIELRELRKIVNMNRREFAEYFEIPLRTVEDWEAGRRKMPAYLLRLITYRVKTENIFAQRVSENRKDILGEDRSINIIRDSNGNQVVVIDDIRFKGKQSISWDEVEKYLKQYVGDFYTIAETKDFVYIGIDLPDEYANSKYTSKLRGAVAKAKANAAQVIPELIQISTNCSFVKNYELKHEKDAQYGWYRYDSRFALAIYDNIGEIVKYNVFKARMIIRHDSNGRRYLYDVINIKKETEYPA
jgi:transcriptional regulator with XRE-family HTH domain